MKAERGSKKGSESYDRKQLLETALNVFHKYLGLIYGDPDKYRPTMDENEVIDTLQIIAWAGEDEQHRIFDSITWARNVPC